MKGRWIGGLVVVVLLLGLFSCYTVGEAEQVIITQFGEPVGAPVTAAGLHFKLPFVQKVVRIEKRILQWDGTPEQVVTNDKKYIHFDTMARWRIVDPLKFLQTVRDETGAGYRLEAIIEGEVRDVVSSHPLIEVVRTTDREMARDLSEVQDSDTGRSGAPEDLHVAVGREGMAALILESARASAAELGIELIDVRVKRINYVDRVLQDVYERMISERERIAARYRSEGEGERSTILGQLDRELKSITSEAFRRAEEVRGQADAEAAGIYAEAYEQDPEFYAFTKTLETYETALANGDVTLVLSAESELFRWLRGEAPR